jgi:hypothetical protein
VEARSCRPIVAWSRQRRRYTAEVARSTLGHVVALVGSIGACDGVAPASDATAGTEAPGLVLVAQVELGRSCDLVGAVEVQIRARRIGCERPTPCTVPAEPPEILGDRATCPSAEAERWMGVRIDRSGRYLVDAVVHFATGDPVFACLEEAGQVDVLVTSDDLDGGGDRILEVGEMPCPEP